MYTNLYDLKTNKTEQKTRILKMNNSFQEEMNELKATVINLKSLSQNIPDPIVVGAGDANGRTLRVIFTQEAAAQMTEDT